MKNITILGSTGSIGTQALQIIREKKEEYKVIAISAYSNADLLFEQAVEFLPEYVVISDESKFDYLKNKLKLYNIKVLKGVEGLVHISVLDNVDIVLTAVVGMIGIIPTINAIRANKTIALANKETMVAAGELINKELKRSAAKIIPVDSEHCALFQCLSGENKEEVRKLILTASGGPFRGMKKNELFNIPPERALKHPKWNMGRKISIDSATLMNKGLEVIEAHYLFNTDYDRIDVIVHPESIIHSMVEYMDGSIKAQMSNTSMLHPIQYAFEYPQRSISTSGYLNLAQCSSLSFEEPDYDTFECLRYGYEAGKTGGSMTCVLNAANEEAVENFLNNRISFLQIGELIKHAMVNHTPVYDLTLDKIIEIEKTTKNYVNSLID